MQYAWVLSMRQHMVLYVHFSKRSTPNCGKRFVHSLIFECTLLTGLFAGSTYESTYFFDRFILVGVKFCHGPNNGTTSFGACQHYKNSATLCAASTSSLSGGYQP